MVKFLVGVASIAVVVFVAWIFWGQWSTGNAAEQQRRALTECRTDYSMLDAEARQPTMSEEDRRALIHSVEDCRTLGLR